VSTQTTTLALDYVKTIGITTIIWAGALSSLRCGLEQGGRIFVLNHCDSARRALIRVGIMNWDRTTWGVWQRRWLRGRAVHMPVAMALIARNDCT